MDQSEYEMLTFQFSAYINNNERELAGSVEHYANRVTLNDRRSLWFNTFVLFLYLTTIGKFQYQKKKTL